MAVSQARSRRPFVDWYHERYLECEAQLSDPVNRDTRRYPFFGVTIVSEIGMSTLLFGVGRERWVQLPARTTWWHRSVAFVLTRIFRI